MSLNSRRAGTLKSKLAQFYVIMFMMTQFLCVLVFFLCLRHSVYSQARKRSVIFIGEFTYEYMTGGEYTHDKGQLKTGRFDPGLLAAVRAKEPGFRPQLGYVTDQGALGVLGASKHGVFEFTMQTDGSGLSRREYTVDDRIGLMNLEFNEESYGEDIDHIFFLLLSPQGGVLARSEFTSVDESLFTDRIPSMEGGDQTIRLPHERYGILTRYHWLHDGNILVIGEDLRQIGRYVANLFYGIVLTLAVSLLVSFYSGRLIAGRFVGGVKRVAGAAHAIAAGDYAARVAHGREGAEIDDLADAFNNMTAKTERLLKDLKSISENLAHDLRTPLTRLRGQAEMSLSAPGCANLAADVAEECAGMLTMINNMLEITRAECDADAPPPEEMDVAAAARNTREMFSTVADDKGVSLHLELQDDPLMLRVDKIRLQRLLANLVDNAIKFTPAGGKVTLRVVSDEDGVVIRVADTGCGIPERDQKQIFDRFYRSDASRHIPGNGLGLSLVKAITESCGGQIMVESREGHGSVFEVKLPS